MIGQRFGRWIVIGTATSSRDGKRRVTCRCDCGNERPVYAIGLKNGRSTQCKICGSNIGARSFKHGDAGYRETPEYRAWKGMKSRCYNPNRIMYPDYGGRGIQVCQEWRESYPAFRAHVGPRPTDGHSLNRIDNDGNYEPGNVNWATATEQSRNRRARRWYRRPQPSNSL